MAHSDKSLVALVEELIELFQNDENRFYVELDLAHQLLEQLMLTTEQDAPSE